MDLPHLHLKRKGSSVSVGWSWRAVWQWFQQFKQNAILSYIYIYMYIYTCMNVGICMHVIYAICHMYKIIYIYICKYILHILHKHTFMYWHNNYNFDKMFAHNIDMKYTCILYTYMMWEIEATSEDLTFFTTVAPFLRCQKSLQSNQLSENSINICQSYSR